VSGVNGGVNRNGWKSGDSGERPRGSQMRGLKLGEGHWNWNERRDGEGRLSRRR